MSKGEQAREETRDEGYAPSGGEGTPGRVVRYQVEERDQPVPELPACGNCGSALRHTAELTLGRIAVDSFAALARDYEARWPGCLVDMIQGGYRIVGPHACGCPGEQPG